LKGDAIGLDGDLLVVEVVTVVLVGSRMVVEVVDLGFFCGGREVVEEVSDRVFWLFGAFPPTRPGTSAAPTSEVLRGCFPTGPGRELASASSSR
jgi:hypothetical protein